MDKVSDLMERLTSLCKRRGFIFQSSEIYGGLNGCWDYGPLGVELKRNVKNTWWRDVVTSRDDMVGLDASIIMNPKVWEASGHVGGFSDPMVDCKKCKGRFRADQLYYALRQGQSRQGGVASVGFSAIAGTVEDAVAPMELQLKKKGRQIREWDNDFELIRYDQQQSEQAPCPGCGEPESLTDPRAFNLMFKTHVGALEGSSSVAYLRPETAQGIFCNFKNVLDTQRLKLPFGIAQIGKAFRNEINPRNFTFRSREFEQMEIEYFCHPDQADQWYQSWRQERFDWYVNLGLRSEKVRLRDHEENELAHYAKGCADIEYEFPFGISELEGIANRTDYDLGRHQESSGKDLSYYDDQTKERFLPYVIEPSAGVDRSVLAFLCEAYTEDEAPDDKGVAQKRVVMKLHPKLAPIKAAVFPLVKKDGMPEIAHKIHEELKDRWNVFYDEKGAVGRRYRRQDETGTPFCITVDGQTLEDQTVTIRERDSLAQERVSREKIVSYLSEHLGN